MGVPATPNSRGMWGAIHEVKVRERRAWVPDPEGRVLDDEIEWPVRGIVSQASARELENLGRFGEQVSAVLRCPPDSRITANDQVAVSGVDAILDGVYEVATIRSTIRGPWRVYLRRSE